MSGSQLYPLVDIITPNEVEASQLTGLPVDSLQTAAAAAEVLLEQGAKQAIVTLGGGGVFCATGKESFAIPAGCISLSQGYIYNTCDLARAGRLPRCARNDIALFGVAPPLVKRLPPGNGFRRRKYEMHPFPPSPSQR